MFLNSKFVLANELVLAMNVNIANISILHKSLKHLNHCPIKKLNSLSFIDKTSVLLPKNIATALNENEFTDISNMLPCNYVASMYGIRQKELFNADLITDVVTIANKKFFVFKDDFVKQMRNKIPYVLDYDETMSCHNNGQIDGYIKLKNNKYLTWY